VSSLHGSDDIDTRLTRINAWRAGDTSVFLSKPVMYGAGVNLQQSHSMFFAGVGFKAKDFLQAVHRIHRFLQAHPCDVHIVYTDAEREVRRVLEEKWREHDALVARMTEIVRAYGLTRNAMSEEMRRASTVSRDERSGEGWRLIHNDTVLETMTMESDSVDLIVTSIPFSTQYEYTPSYLDFGHTDDNEHFWKQMDWFIPELLRVLKPGRLCAIHVKDRIVPSGLTGMGFQTVYPFHCDAIAAFTEHGFGFLGQKTIVTDVVRENNQTYRLAWTEQCKDGTKMGVGMPEYLLLFRKPPTDRSNGYADDPVVKSKAEYSLGRWQVDAHAFTRSSGNRLLSAEDLFGLTHAQIFQAFKKHSLSEVYDFDHHVALADSLRDRGLLPVTFMLLQPHTTHPDVWSDITRMRTLNMTQASKGREGHLCPLQFDIVDRAIVQWSMPGELVFDPFAGLGTVPYCAMKLKRRGLGVELNPRYFADAVNYCRAAEREVGTPTLFDLGPAIGDGGGDGIE
jgi:DNA modification methylase